MAQVRDGKCGSWRAGRPPDLFADGGKQYRGGKFRLLRCAVGSGDGRLNFREDLMLAGAGGPDSLQTSPPVRRLDRAASFSACGPPGLTLPGCARQLLNRRSGSARLRSTASQSLLAALRNAKQFSHMAPCCFAKRKAVLSHALAALTALNKSAVQAVEICFAALDAYPGGSQGKKMVRSRGLEPRTQ